MRERGRDKELLPEDRRNANVKQLYRNTDPHNPFNYILVSYALVSKH